jgi:hypothetical protein
LQFLDFSTILYDFSKVSTRGSKSGFWFYEQVPGFHSYALRWSSTSAIGSLGAASSGDRRNPAKGGPGLAGKVAVDDEGLTLGQFEGLEAEGGAPASELGGAMDGQPWELLLRRVGAQHGVTGSRGDSSGA